MSEQKQTVIKTPVKTKVPLLIDGKEVPSDFLVFPDLNEDHAAIGLGNWEKMSPTPIRLHSECLTGDVFHSMRCDCYAQLQETIREFSQTGGIIVYLRQEGRGIGLVEKIKAYTLQDQGFDTYEANTKLGHPADARNYDDAIAILKALGVTEIILKSNNPLKVGALDEAGIKIVDRISTEKHTTKYNKGYLDTKIASGHIFESSET